MIRIQARISTRTSCQLFFRTATELLHVKIEETSPVGSIFTICIAAPRCTSGGSGGADATLLSPPPPWGAGRGGGWFVRTQRSRSCPPEMMTSLLFHIRPPLGAPNEQLWCYGGGGGVGGRRDWQTHHYPPLVVVVGFNESRSLSFRPAPPH